MPILSILGNLNRNIAKLSATAKDFKKTTYHRHGRNPISYLKFIYYTLFRLNTFIVYENDLRHKLVPHNLDPEFSIIKPSMEELEEIRRGKDLTREFYCDQIQGAKTCYLAFCGEELAYIHWLFFKGDDSRFLKIGDGIAEVNYITTLPKFRGRRLSSKMVAYLSHDLKNLGYKKLRVVIHEFNYPSIKCIKLAGFKEVNRIRALGPFHRKISV